MRAFPKRGFYLWKKKQKNSNQHLCLFYQQDNRNLPPNGIVTPLESRMQTTRMIESWWVLYVSKKLSLPNHPLLYEKNDWKGFQSMRANNAIKELRSYSPMWPNAKIFSSEKHWCVILRTSPVRDFYTFHPRTFGARGCSSSLTPMAHHLTATQGQDRLAEKAKSRPFMFQQIYCAMVITMVSTAGSSRNPSHNGFFVNGYIHNHKSLWMMTIPKSVGATQHKQCSKPQNHPYFHCTSWLRFPHGLW